MVLSWSKFLVPLPFYHPYITKVKLDDKAETELKTALAKYYQNIGFGVQCEYFQCNSYFSNYLWHEIIMDVLDSAMSTSSESSALVILMSL